MSEWIQVFKYVQIQEQNHMVSNHTLYRTIQQIYSLQCLQVAHETQESQLQNVSTCYKQIRKDMNTVEHTWTNQWYLINSHHILIIKSSFQGDESWEEDHQHQPHGSSRPLPHPWAFPQQSDTLITLIHRIVMHSFCTPHGKSFHLHIAHITEIHGILWILCGIWYCIASYDIYLQSLAL